MATNENLKTFCTLRLTPAPAPSDADGSVHGLHDNHASAPDTSAHNGSRFSGGSTGTRFSGAAPSRRRSTIFEKRERRKSENIAAGHLRAKDIVHINTSAKGLECMQRVITPDKVTIADAVVFLLLYFGSVCIFAALLYAVSPDGACYKLEEPDHFDYDTALWISMHAFSTIGFGSIAPKQRCAAAQLIVFIESFVALLVYGFISGYIVKMFLRPTSRIRFSKNLLLNNGHRRVESEYDDELESVRGHGEYKYLTFRMVREGRVKMRNVHVRMEAQYWHSIGGKNGGNLDGREHHRGRVVSLSLEQDLFTTIEQLQVWHKVDEHSPLWKMRDHLGDHLDGVEVSVSAFDMASEQPVMMFKRYDVRDVIVNAVFDNNFAYNPKDKSGEQLLSDHSRLDNIIQEHREDSRRGSGRCSLGRCRSVGRVNFLPANIMSGSSFRSAKRNSGRERPSHDEDVPPSSPQQLPAPGDGDIESGSVSRDDGRPKPQRATKVQADEFSDSDSCSATRPADRPLVSRGGAGNGGGAELAV